MSSSQPVTYQHTAAVVEYKPAVDVEPTQGWRMECDKEISSRLAPPSFNTFDCVGASRRLTRRQGASASFTTYGSSFVIFGSVTGGSFSVRIGDGTEEVREPDTATDGVLFAAEGLGSGSHLIILTSVSENTELRFARVEFDAGVRSNWTRTTIGAREVSAWTFSAGWVKMNNPIRGSDGDTVEMQTGYNTKTIGAEAFLRFQGNAIWILGNVMVEHSGYTVTLISPESPSLPGATQTGTFNSLSQYTVAGALTYFAGGLDPRVTQTLRITVLDSALPGFDLIGAEVVTGDPPVIELPSASSTPSPTPVPTSTPKHQGINTPSVIGAAFGGVVVGLACVAVFYYLRKRYLRQQHVRPGTTDEPTEFASLQSYRDTSAPPHSHVMDGVRPIFLPSIGQSSYSPEEAHNMEKVSGMTKRSNGGSPPVSTQGASTSISARADHVPSGALVLPPAYSARGLSD